MLPFHSRYTVRLEESRLKVSAAREMNEKDMWQFDTSGLSYVDSGFLMLQALVNEAIISKRMNQSGVTASVDLLHGAARLTDVKPWNENFGLALRYIAATYLIISFFPLGQKFLQLLVLEKEKKTKEGMKMMGLAEWAFFGGWMVTYVALGVISCSILAGLFVYSELYQQTAVLAVWILLVLCKSRVWMWNALTDTHSTSNKQI